MQVLIVNLFYRHEVVNVNLKFKPDWFFARHPFGLVPILEHNDDVVCESAVCDDYLDEVYPDPPLYPRDVREKTRHKMIMSMFERVSLHRDTFKLFCTHCAMDIQEYIFI